MQEKERKSLLWQEAEKLLAKQNLSLEKVADGSYLIKLPSGDSVRMSSLTQIIVLFKHLSKEV